MKPIAIFYHVYLGGGEIPCDHDNVIGIVTEQLSALNVSGVSKHASHICIGVKGSDMDAFMLKSMEPLSLVVRHESGIGELPTMKLMQDFCRKSPGWNILYLHTKGAIHGSGSAYSSWRLCMESVCLWRWSECVRLMDEGADSVGAHWLTPEAYPFIGSTAYWGGNFWWATSDFLNTLPEINVDLSRYEAEVWIGRGPKRPVVRDLKHHFPMSGC